MKITPANYLKEVLTLPGDKSISHRAALLAAMAMGETRIENFATSADCALTLDCLRTLGVEIRRDGKTVFVTDVGKTGFRTPSENLDCGNSPSPDFSTQRAKRKSTAQNVREFRFSNFSNARRDC